MVETSDNTICWVSTIGDLLAGHGGKDRSVSKPLMIPPYQRRFAWGEEHVTRLCKDVCKAISDGAASYHLGTLIFHQDGERWAVVDGQQRLTSIGAILGEEDFVEREKGFTEEDRAMIRQVVDRFADHEKDIREFVKQCTVVCILVDNVAEAFQLFDTQNGRGKELSSVNLLKAYHFHEMSRPGDLGHSPSDKRVREIEMRWETSNGMKEHGGKRLLQHVFAEHLFRLRRWCRGEFNDDGFKREHIGEFKGLTISESVESLPLQNAAVLRRLFREHYTAFGFSLDGVSGRLGADRKDPRGMDPFATISQPIVNGEDFFNYAETYAIIYRELFPVTEDREGKRKISVSFQDPELEAFGKFHRNYCLYDKHRRCGDTYARHVFESLCIFCFDRFGSKGLNTSYESLYRFSYYERATLSHLLYKKAGSTFACACIGGMQRSETMAEFEGEVENLLLSVNRESEAFVKECQRNPKRTPFKFYGWEKVLGHKAVEHLLTRQGQEVQS